MERFDTLKHLQKNRQKSFNYPLWDTIFLRLKEQLWKIQTKLKNNGQKPPKSYQYTYQTVKYFLLKSGVHWMKYQKSYWLLEILEKKSARRSKKNIKNWHKQFRSICWCWTWKAQLKSPKYSGIISGFFIFKQHRSKLIPTKNRSKRIESNGQKTANNN